MEDVELRQQFATIGKRFDSLESLIKNQGENLDALAIITAKNFAIVHERMATKATKGDIKLLNAKIEGLQRSIF